MSYHFPKTSVVVTAVTDFPAVPQALAGEEMTEWAFVHTGAAGVIEYSFDTINPPLLKVVHGSMTIGTDTSSMVERCKDRSVWFRRQAAGAGICSCDVFGARTT